MSDVIGLDAAITELLAVQTLFDAVYTGNERELILLAIQEGRLLPDEKRGLLDYALAVPVELKNSEVVTNLEISIPSYPDLEYINRGFTVKVDKEGETIMDMSFLMRRAIRAVGRLTGKPAAIVERISRKDMRVLAALLSFFD